jgi:hypothetical protein
LHRALWGAEDTLTDHISAQVANGTCDSSSPVNALFVHFGQFLAHDLSHSTPQANMAHDEFMPMSVQSDDPAAVTTLKIRRSMWVPGEGGVREQVNHQSAWLDASAVYGVSGGVSAALREYTGGRLLDGGSSSAGKGGSGSSGGATRAAWLRQSSALSSCLSGAAGSAGLPLNGGNMVPTDNPLSRVGGCLMASGDARGNAALGLTSVHALMVRLHNWLAGGIIEELKLNRHKRKYRTTSKLRQLLEQDVPQSVSRLDDAIFETVRGTVAAVLQMWTYHDYLPRVLGPQWRNARLGGCATGDAQRCILSAAPPMSTPPAAAGITNEFSTAAFRFGHAQAPDVVPLDVEDCSGSGVSAEAACPYLRLSDAFFVPLGSDLPVCSAAAEGTPGSNASSASSHLHYGGGSGDVWSSVYARVLRGSVGHEARPVCGTFAPSMHHRLFGHHRAGGLVDMPAINIQRGRDHGLRSYGEYEQWAAERWAKVQAAAGKQGHTAAAASAAAPLSSTSISALTAAYGAAAVKAGDVDVFAGGILEEPVAGGLVGRTFAAVLDEQFTSLAQLDSSFHTREWSPSELSVLWRALSLRRTLCALAVPHTTAAREGAGPVPTSAAWQRFCMEAGKASGFDVL